MAKTDIGPPNYKNFLPPVIQKNYGKWKYHEIIKPGVLKHVAESGDGLFSVASAHPGWSAPTVSARSAILPTNTVTVTSGSPAGTTSSF